MPADLLPDRSANIRAAMRWILAAFYAAAGIAHLWAPDKLLAITPSWVPFAPQVIFITGLCELVGAAALVTRPLRWWAGVALAAYAICVWPANFKHAIDGIDLRYAICSSTTQTLVSRLFDLPIILTRGPERS